MVEFSDKTKQSIREMREHFLVPLNGDDFFLELKSLISTCPLPYKTIVRAFIHNLSAVISTTTLPFTLSSASAHHFHANKFRMAEAIRALNIDPQEGEDHSAIEKRRQLKAEKIAILKFKTFSKSNPGIDALTHDIASFLLAGIKTKTLVDAAHELLHQGLVLIWGSFEVLSRDIFVSYLNKSPQAARQLLADPAIKRRFELSKISIESLADRNFDLSDCMGELFSKEQDMSDLATIKSLYLTLFPKLDFLKDSLSQKDLWELGQQRNLIVHRRGIVDELFQKNSGVAQKIGEKLKVAPSLIERHLNVVNNAGKSIILAATKSG